MARTNSLQKGQAKGTPAIPHTSFSFGEGASQSDLDLTLSPPDG